MNIIGILIVLLSSPYALINLSRTSNTSPQPTFKEIVKSNNSSLERSNNVVKTQSDLQRISQTSPESFKNIDLANNMVIVASMGEKSSGGYSIEITNIAENESGIRVEIIETSPGSSCMTTMALTSPAHIVEYKKSEKPVTFITKKVVNDCK